MTRKKYEKPLTLDADFDEALERFAQVDPDEMADRPTKGAAIENLMLAFENAAHHDQQGEYWLARELYPLLGYKSWQKFEDVIARARAACEGVGEPPENHFIQVDKMVSIGSGAEREQEDVELTRTACYLIAQNGDPTRRPEIAAAQTYFALQTQRQERADQALAAQQLTDDQKRVLLRDKLKEHNKLLAEAAKTAGVSNFKNFNGAGLKGLYGGLSQAQVVRRKKLPPGSNHLDFAGHSELAANYFKATQAEEKLRRRIEKDGEIGQREAERVHKQVGTDLHEFITSQGNTPPEDMVPADHIKEARKRVKASQPKKVGKKG